MNKAPAIISGVSTKETDLADARMRHWRPRMLMACRSWPPADASIIAAVLGVNGGLVPRLSMHGAHIDRQGRAFCDMVDASGQVHRKVWFGHDKASLKALFSRACDAIRIETAEHTEFCDEIRKWIGLDMTVADQQKEMLK